MKVFLLALVLFAINAQAEPEKPTPEAAADYYVEQYLSYKTLPLAEEGGSTLVSVKAKDGKVTYSYDLDFLEITEGYVIKSKEEFKFAYSQYHANFEKIQYDTYCRESLLGYLKLGVSFESIMTLKNTGVSVITNNKIINSVNYNDCKNSHYFK